MISLQNTDSIIAVSLAFFAFTLSITVSGTVQAYVAKLMGDDTASQMGFADLNPFMHIGFFDLIYFILIDVMLGNLIPINILEIKQTKRPLRLFLVFGSRAITHIVIAIISGFSMILINATTRVTTATTLDPVQMVANLREQLPPALYVISLLCAAMTFSNIFLGAFALLRDSIYGVLLFKFEKDPSFIAYINPIMIFGFLLIWIFFARQIMILLGSVVAAGVTLCGAACGL